MDLAVFSRIVGIIFTPSNFMPLLLAVGLLLQFTVWRRLGKYIVFFVTLTFFLIYFLPMDEWLRRPLEERFHRAPWPTHVDGVIVLAGGQGRMMAAAELARRYPTAKLIYSGGAPPLQDPAIAEAATAPALFEELGVPRSRLIWETNSRNTWESLVYSKKLVSPRAGETWLIVTSAMHMPRALGVAARIHWHVLPWPAGYNPAPKTYIMDWDSSVAERLVQIEAAAHEWVALATYRMLDRLGDVAT